MVNKKKAFGGQQIYLANPKTNSVVLVTLEGSAIKFVAFRGYDKLLCNHVYMGFCPNCPQYKCRKRRV